MTRTPLDPALPHDSGSNNQALRQEPPRTPASDAASGLVSEAGATVVIEPFTWGGLEVRGKLGEGTFGEVFLGFDPKLERQVALKLLKARSTDANNRILLEARALARLRHDGVVHVYGAEMHDGRVGLWMELVRGRTLETLVRERHGLGAREAALIGQDLCRALAAVHQAGMTHGDLKAQNVMREDGGRLVLMDFGAGRSSADHSTGQITGTPLYLAPELLNGGPATPSSDLYSLGVLLFHLVTARFPFEGDRLDTLMRAHAQGTRLRLHDLRPELPDAFVRVIERATAERPEDRYTSAGDMLAALSNVLGGHAAPGHGPTTADTSSRRAARWAGVALLAVAVIVAALVAAPRWPGRAPKTATASAGGAIAVLPFRVIGGDQEAAYFSEGLSDDVTAQLARLASVRLVSGISMRRFKDTTRLPAEIGRELGVGRLVTGSIRLTADRLRIVVEVVDCATSDQLWAETIERPRSESAAAEIALVRDVAAALKGPLSPQDAKRLDRPAIDNRAFELYLRGRYFWNQRTPDGLRRSIELFKEAKAIDPLSALPEAGLADAYLLAGYYFIAPATARTAAEAAARRAVELDPNLAEAHAALGMLHMLALRWNDANVSFGRAMELNPSYAPAHHWYALGLAEQGRFAEAVTSIAEARKADPLSTALVNADGFILYVQRNFSGAVARYREVLKSEPANYLARAGLVETYVAQGDLAAASRELDEAKQVLDATSDLRVYAALLHAAAGDAARARQELAEIESALASRPVSLVDVAGVYATLGDTDRAFAWLTRAFDQHDDLLGNLKVTPKLDSLRRDPRFAAMLGKAGLSTD